MKQFGAISGLRARLSTNPLCALRPVRTDATVPRPRRKPAADRNGSRSGRDVSAFDRAIHKPLNRSFNEIAGCFKQLRGASDKRIQGWVDDLLREQVDQPRSKVDTTTRARIEQVSQLTNLDYVKDETDKRARLIQYRREIGVPAWVQGDEPRRYR